MYLFPAIDLYENKAVRLLKGDYARMTVYHNDPLAVAAEFQRVGAHCIHLVDLEGARDGTTPHRELVRAIAGQTSLFTEIGGGIRTLQTVERYLEDGVDRVILGTAAVTDPAFLAAAVKAYGARVAVGADVRDGRIAIKGWTENSTETLDAFCRRMQSLGVETLICTDISRDGAMQGTNRALYRDLCIRYSLQITASGGVSTLADIEALQKQGLYAAILGKAYYTGAVQLTEALEAAHDYKTHYSLS